MTPESRKLPFHSVYLLCLSLSLNRASSDRTGTCLRTLNWEEVLLSTVACGEVEQGADARILPKRFGVVADR